MSGSKRLLWAGAVVVAGVLVFLGVKSSSGNAPAVKTSAARAASAPPPERAPAAKSTVRTQTTKPRATANPTTRPEEDGQRLGPTPASPPDEDPLRELREAKADPSQAGTDQLISALTSRDDVVVAEAANELISRRATEAIGPLAKIQLRDAAGSGLSVIDALGRLGKFAKDGEKTQAVERLLALLESEKQRNAPESAGNLLQLYEALGRTGDPRAAGALEAELLDPSVGRAPKVVIVQSLVWLAQPSSHDALVEARKLQFDLPPADDFDAELRTELLGVIDAALEEL